MPLGFTPQQWERIERDYEAWWAHELERPLIQVTGHVYDPTVTYPEFLEFTTDYPPAMSPEEIVQRVTLELEATRYYGDAFPRWWINFGPGIIAGFLGARVHVVPETVWFEPEHPGPLEEIVFRRDPNNYWWQRVQAITRAALEAWQGRVQVTHTDLGGNLDILASFRTTQKLLTDLYDAPEQVERLVAEITQHWIYYYDALDAMIHPVCRSTGAWAPIWSRERTYMLQCDFSYMISPRMFERFVMPDLVACCDHLDRGFYHLDGPGQIAHLDHLLSIPRLCGIQWIPGDGNPPPNEWPDVLRRIIQGGKLCQVYVRPEEALDIVRTLGGKGFLLNIRDTDMDADEASAFLKRMAEEDISLQ